MGTQFVTVDSAPCNWFAQPPAAESPHGGTPSHRENLVDNDFFKGKSIAELSREQGVGPVKDIRVFAGVIPNDEDVDEMLAEIYWLREP
jgi:hypothetical protein